LPPRGGLGELDDAVSPVHAALLPYQAFDPCCCVEIVAMVLTRLVTVATSIYCPGAWKIACAAVLGASALVAPNGFAA
jgi:hypothetical protein